MNRLKSCIRGYEPGRFLALVACWLLAFFVVGCSESKQPEAEQAAAETEEIRHAKVEPSPVPARVQAAEPRIVTPDVAPAVAPAPTPLVVPVAPEMRQLVESLIRPGGTNGVLLPAQAEAWKTNLLQLVQAGASSVPAIREFLEKQLDVDFGPEGTKMLGYSSARLAMFDVLAQIPGPESLAVMANALQTTANPREIAILARNLEYVEPGAHRQDAIEAARQTLAMVRTGKVAETDVAPLFEVFQTYGDQALIDELKSSSQTWSSYSMIALARLPGEAGIPALIEVLNDEASKVSGAQVAALQMLAQAAPYSQTAREAFMEQVKNNKLTPMNWATLELILAGNQVYFRNSAYDPTLAGVDISQMNVSHTSAGNQSLYSGPPAKGLTAEQASAQAALIEQLLTATSDPAAIAMLQRSKKRLADRSANSGLQVTPSN